MFSTEETRAASAINLKMLIFKNIVLRDYITYDFLKISDNARTNQKGNPILQDTPWAPLRASAPRRQALARAPEPRVTQSRGAPRTRRGLRASQARAPAAPRHHRGRPKTVGKGAFCDMKTTRRVYNF